VLVLATTHEVEQPREASADLIIQDSRSVTFESIDASTGRLSIKISRTLR
jgi:hypothetical protein